jgi:tryptophan synthase alpha chain
LNAEWGIADAKRYTSPIPHSAFAHSTLDSMSAVDTLFTDLRSRSQKALMPFVTAGDPDLSFTAAVLRELVIRGASLFELGIPYSDPIADGPVIQASYTRALAKHVRLDGILDMLKRTASTLSAPVVTMVSYAIVHRHGLERYVDDAQAAGAAGAIVPDLPVEEADSLAKICRRRDFSLIQLVTPTTPRERAVRIANGSTGFLYYVSVTGITGERTALPPEVVDNVGWLRKQTPLPICIGFGISTPEHVQRLAPVADGLIVGSAIVKRVAAAESRPREQVVAEVGDYVESLIKALAQ